MSEKKKEILIALAGNPNCGKSTLFNALTGAKQHVGNYPGVTVEKKEGKAKHGGYSFNIVDLPGTYSLSSTSEDELVAREFITTEKPDVIVHVVDSSNLERNLYLFTQLAELNIPIVIAMNMTDIVESRGVHIDYDKLSKLLGKPLVKTVGSKNKGIDELFETAIGIYEGKIEVEHIAVDYGEDINKERCKLECILNCSGEDFQGRNIEWLSMKLLEKDDLATKITSKTAVAEEVSHQVSESRHHLLSHFGEDPEVMIADRRYGFVSGACSQTVTKSSEERYEISDKIDRVILNRFLGLPIFALVMYIIFMFTFTVSGPVVEIFEGFFGHLSDFVIAHTPEGLTQSFIVDGIIGGVGGVLGFFPLIMFMFFAIAFFEDSGYMSRAAFIMDRVMNKFGLHGKSFLPMMISTNGCAVPGILASRTLDNKKDRLITMMVTPFMICGAKLPIFALFIGAFFSAKNGTNIMFLMYILSIVIAFTSAWILKKFVFKGEVSHFVMELPPYRIPTLRGLLLKMWERGWEYLKKAGTVILMVSIIIWASFTFPEHKAPEGVSPNVAAEMQMEQSVAGKVGKFIEPAMEPIGMDWKSGVALMAGVAAKEIVVSTLGTIYSLGEVDVDESESLQDYLQHDSFWTPLKAVVFMIFSLIYMPCIVAMTVFYRESGSSAKWTSFLIVSTTLMAWLISFLVYQGGKILGY